MRKFDTSIGLKKNQIDIIKYAVKNEINTQLPLLPEPIETKLFFEGRDAWVYSWSLKKPYPLEPKDEISLEVVAKLKKEFHYCNKTTHYKFSCKVQQGQDFYRPKVFVIKKSA
jgi:hypothetical protein